MKKNYCTPAMAIYQAETANMIAASLEIIDTTVDGSEALTKEDTGWDIWNDED